MAKKTSGLDTRLIGQALAGPRPLGTDEILGDAFKRGEIAINKMQAKRDAEEKEKKAELERFDRAQARLLRSMPKFNKEKLVKGYKPVATKILSAARQEYISLISDPNKSEVEKEMARQKFQDALSEVDAKNSEFKDKINFFATITSDDLSKANTAFTLKRHRDIVEGNWAYDDATDSLKFTDGESVPMDQVMKQGVINKRDDAYLKMLTKVSNEALKSGAKGDDEAIFNKSVENVINGMEFTDADRISIAADFLGYDIGSIGPAIKADIEADGDLDDPKLREQLDDFIKQNVMQAAKDNFFEGKKTYNDKVAIEKSKPIEQIKISAKEQVNDFISNRERWIRTNIGPAADILIDKSGKMIVEIPVKGGKDSFEVDKPEDIIRIVRRFGSAPGGLKGAQFDLGVQEAVRDLNIQSIDISEFK